MGPSVYRQKIELICVIQMLMLSSLRLSLCVCVCVVVAQSEERIGRWAVGGAGCLVVEVQASSHPLWSFCTGIKENGHDLMTRSLV